MSETYLVTGAAGFVGSRLSKALLSRGQRVIGLDNLNEYYPLFHKKRHLADLMPEANFTFVQGDICDAPAMRTLMETHKPTAIAHLAAMAAVRYSVEHPLIYGTINVQGAMNLMDAAGQHRLALWLGHAGAFQGNRCGRSPARALSCQQARDGTDGSRISPPVETAHHHRAVF
jgi:nucleoside-diphosphate-sugar epimerase